MTENNNDCVIIIMDVILLNDTNYVLLNTKNLNLPEIEKDAGGKLSNLTQKFKNV